MTRGASVLADVGGPYILAPVGGSLRVGGRTVGHYVLSVQDDSGYVKLETRFIGLPMIIKRGGSRLPLEGTIAPGATPVPSRGPFRHGGADWETVSFPATAFPSGPLTITLLVPPPPSSAAGCASIAADELGQIAHTTWSRFLQIGAPPSSYVLTAEGLTGGLSYVRAGSRQIAGSTRPGPGRLPTSGTVRYGGRLYTVRSFSTRIAAGPARVYLLLKP